MPLHPMYEVYLQERRNADSADFCALRETIARSLVVDGEFAQWYLDRLRGRGFGFAPTYADVARHAEPGHGGASLAEATQETVRRVGAITTTQEMLAQCPGWQYAVIGGSFPWKRYNMLSSACRSDLDVTAVFHAVPNELGTDDALNAQLERFHRQDCAPMLKHKLVVNGISVSLHVWTTETMQMMRSLDYAGLDREVAIPCLREPCAHGTAETYGPQCNFAGDAYTMPKHVRVHAGGNTICDQHIACIGVHGEFVIGAALDMMLFGAEVMGPRADQFVQTKHTIVQSLRVRMHKDAEKLPDKSLSFANLPHNRDRMPRWLLQEIRAWDEECA